MVTADSFGGIAGNETAYLVGRDKLCRPLVVSAAKAAGSPTCAAASTEEIAALSIKSPPQQRGSKATHSAVARGTTIAVHDRDGAELVTWAGPDPVGAIVGLWTSTYGRLIVVEFTVRRMGREVHDLVGFDLGVGGARPAVASPPAAVAPTPPVLPAPAAPDPVPVPSDPELQRRIAKARKARGQAAIAAWSRVLERKPGHGEARYRLAVAHARARRRAEAIAELAELAASPAPDAREWSIEARFDQAFAALVAEPAFRAAVGFDRPPQGAYERLMGLGGGWEQALTPCERPEITLRFARARTFALELKSACQGQRDRLRLRGTWAVSGEGVELRLAGADQHDEVAPCEFFPAGDEDVLRCQVDEDLSFEGRPVRR